MEWENPSIRTPQTQREIVIEAMRKLDTDDLTLFTSSGYPRVDVIAKKPASISPRKSAMMRGKQSRQSAVADLTAQMTFDSDWSEIGAGLSLDDGDDYVLDVVGLDLNAIVYSADTDANNAPTDAIIGHPWYPAEDPAREYAKDSAVFTWLRVTKGEAILVGSKI